MILWTAKNIVSNYKKYGGETTRTTPYIRKIFNLCSKKLSTKYVHTCGNPLSTLQRTFPQSSYKMA